MRRGKSELRGWSKFDNFDDYECQKRTWDRGECSWFLRRREVDDEDIYERMDLYHVEDKRQVTVAEEERLQRQVYVEDDDGVHNLKESDDKTTKRRERRQRQKAREA